MRTIKFTTEDLMNAMGLKVGDKFRFLNGGSVLEITKERRVKTEGNGIEFDFASMCYLNRELEILSDSK